MWNKRKCEDAYFPSGTMLPSPPSRITAPPPLRSQHEPSRVFYRPYCYGLRDQKQIPISAESVVGHSRTSVLTVFRYYKCQSRSLIDLCVCQIVLQNSRTSITSQFYFLLLYYKSSDLDKHFITLPLS
jgi:hypothetical protein